MIRAKKHLHEVLEVELRHQTTKCKTKPCAENFQNLIWKLTYKNHTRRTCGLADGPSEGPSRLTRWSYSFHPTVWQSSPDLRRVNIALTHLSCQLLIKHNTLDMKTLQIGRLGRRTGRRDSWVFRASVFCHSRGELVLQSIREAGRTCQRPLMSDSLSTLRGRRGACQVEARPRLKGIL